MHAWSERAVPTCWTNAIKYTDRGSINLTAQSEAAAW